MSERKVLSKYYPPDFDPSTIARRRGPKPTGPKVQTVRVAAPFSLRCTTCGEYIYKGRKFNARKETPVDEKYLGIQIFRFYIRCTRCSAEITYKTDPKNNDYAMEKGAKRNTEPWRQKDLAEETDEQRLDRLEQEMKDQEEQEERNAMAELEQKTADAHREMAVADALDEIRSRAARRERAAKDGVEVGVVEDAIDSDAEELQRRQDEEDGEYARKIMAQARAKEVEDFKKEEEEKKMKILDDARFKKPMLPLKRRLDGSQNVVPALKLLKRKKNGDGGGREEMVMMSTPTVPPQTVVAVKKKTGLALVDYGSDSDE